MKKTIKTLLIVLVILVMVAACRAKPEEEQVSELAGEPTALPQVDRTHKMSVLVHDSFAVSEAVIFAFEEANDVNVSFIKAGDAGAALNRAILTKDAPIADVFYGVDNTFLSRAIEEDLFEAYDSPLLADIDDRLKQAPNNEALPVDFGDVCLNYDKAILNEDNIPVPTGFESLTNEMYRDMLVVQNPATSSTGLAFLLATIDYFGEDGYLDYWRALQSYGLLVVNDWETAYYGHFSRYAGEQSGRPIVVSYATSPAAELIFSPEPLEEAPTAAVLTRGTCFRQIEFVGILKGTQQRELAEKFVDFMLDEPFQNDIAPQMFMMPVNNRVPTPLIYDDIEGMPLFPVLMDPDLIAEKRDAWIEEWTEAVLR